MVTDHQWRQRWGLHSAETLRLRVQELGASANVIHGLLPARSIAILLGDSGLGKSALMYQAALCVAAGLPFLGCGTVKGRVMIADFENGISDMYELVERISRYLGLPEPPVDLHLWSLNDCEAHFGQVGHNLLDILGDVRPTLAILDSLGSYAPEAEEKNSAATRMLKDFRSLARDCETATVLVHHRRKQPRKTEESAGPLENASIRRWFQEARGASSLMNGSDIRLGVDAPNLSAVSKDEISLVLRGFGRVRGEIDTIYVARDSDENGDPVGYRRLVGSELLFDEHRQRALASLSPQFTFKEAKVAYRRHDQATSNFLQRCVGLGVVRKVGRGRFERVPDQVCQDAGASGEVAYVPVGVCISSPCVIGEKWSGWSNLLHALQGSPTMSGAASSWNCYRLRRYSKHSMRVAPNGFRRLWRTRISSMGTGDDAADRAGTAEEQPATYTRTSSPGPPMCAEGMKTSGSGAEPQASVRVPGLHDTSCSAAVKVPELNHSLTGFDSHTCCGIGKTAASGFRFSVHTKASRAGHVNVGGPEWCEFE
jgi:hypothetical protein